MANRTANLPRTAGQILAVVPFAVLIGFAAGSLAAPAPAVSTQCVDGPSDEERRRMEDAIERNVARLQADGKLAPPTEGSVLLDWPLQAASGLSDPGYHFISRFVDHDPAYPHATLDYNCGDRTYDNSGGNHRGTDIQLWPYPWLKEENDQVEVISAAAGTIVFRQDGQLDQSCCDGSPWNVIAVRHSDGSTAWYGHLKRYSVTSKGVGASVSAGEYLGVVGSSGCTHVPHLHLEVYDASNNLQDPFQGPCNTMNPDSLWLDQRPYNDSAVNRIMTSSLEPYELPGCPGSENPHDKTVFDEDQLIRVTTYFRDILAGQVATFEVRKPDLSIYSTWTYELPPGVEHESKWRIGRILWIWGAIPPPTGEWRFDVHFEGEDYSYPFYVNSWDLTPAGRLGPDLRLGKPTLDGLPLAWTDSSCNPADSSYAIVTGLIGNWNNHGYVTCEMTGTSFDVPLTLVSGNRYYLVAPRSENAIGSFGRDGNGVERPPGVTSYCPYPQVISCPGE